MAKTLFDPIELLGKIAPNRSAMAPMTRNRANPNGDPNELMARYYAQRSSFGVMITEGTAPEQIGKAYPNIPGIFTDSQEAGWRSVVAAVRESTPTPPLFVLQLMHSGRIGHPDAIAAHSELLPPTITDPTPQGPSAIQPAGEIFNGKANVPFATPIEMSKSDIDRAINSYLTGATRAMAAGFDGVELHAANGYLMHQFLADNSNQRSDNYGGSVINRIRFIIEVVDALSEKIGPEKIGIRISPGGSFNDIHESDIETTYTSLIAELNKKKLSYLHLANQISFDAIQFCRDKWQGTLVVNSGYGDKDKINTAHRLIQEGQADIFSFGRLALANPNLIENLKSGATDPALLNTPDSKTFYSGGESGYIDYPIKSS